MLTKEHIIKEDIKAAIEELKRDRSIFEQAEFDFDHISQLFEKYNEAGNSLPIFDFWYDKHKVLEKKVDNLVADNTEFISSLTKAIKAFINSASDISKEIVIKNSKLKDISINQIRSNIDFFKKSVDIMVLYKTEWPAYQMPSNEQSQEISNMENAFFDIEENYVKKNTVKLGKTNLDFDISTNINWLISDDRLNVQSINSDFPISLRK